ncbi:hypothetical protein [Methanobacterium alcaliphilum]|uniref:hypothetical protein n=1 Tax=Methanobacterium alcaliphilum TaxID=392018 RepID=UPI00200AE555|nr:hypothetical protein [Methanobacterium alcaliphilum]MCK9151556.1 hypothetical protein [Methanobacterium alcaliphilum]
MKLKLSLLAILSLFILLMTAGPIFAADDSVNLNNSTYGIDKNQKTSTVTVTSQKKTYTITPNSKPCDKKILGYSTYNKYTKNYYTLISYMKKFEKAGGGVLVLKKGTYTISSTVAVPSNVNIVMNDGVVIKKSTKTGTSRFKASMTIFQLVAPSKLKKSKAYAKYNGVKNVKIIGKGSAVIDMRYIKGNHAIVCGHNRNIQIQGITFKNINKAHFIELDATNKITISNCKFIGAKSYTNPYDEAINLDTPDKTTGGFNNVWSSHDKTPNCNVLIENNYFSGMNRAIGTHKYSQRKTNGVYVTNHGQVYHTNITIRNNKIINSRSYAIRVLNWKNAHIVNNYINNVPSKYVAIFTAGAINLKIKQNYFKNMARSIRIFPMKNVGAGSVYSVTYNSLTSTNYEDMKYNLCVSVADNVVRVYTKYNMFTNPVKTIYLLKS